MRPANTDSAVGRIRRAVKDLERVWAESAEEWADPVAHSFRERRLEPIVPVVKNALDAIERMRALMNEAHRELEG